MNTVELAIRIRRFRKSANMTLADLANASGLTESMMSKIENFRVTPSLSTVSAIAGALGVTLSNLFEGLDDRSELVVVRAHERRRLTRDESPWTYYSLVRERTALAMQPFIIELPSGMQRESADVHEGEEFIFVLQGRIDYEHGDHICSLEPGDSVYSDGSVRHNVWNRSGETARILVVYSASC